MRWILISFLICFTVHISYGKNVAEEDYLLDLVQSLNKKLAKLEESNLETKEKVVKLEAENTGLQRQVANLQRNFYLPKTDLSSSGQSKAQIMRSCAEYRSSDPSLASGNYMIDPDGTESGSPAFEVYCDMSTGATMISHDTEDPTNVTICPEAGCYKRNVTYGTTDGQIRALKAISQDCRQQIQYDCFLAPFEFNGVDYCYWSNEAVHNPTNIFNYWSGKGQVDGDGNLIHTCSCGEADPNTCADTLFKCNCDAYLPELKTDAGYLTNVDHLPVKSLFFGRVTTNSRGTHTLGKFECSGQRVVDTMPSSCMDLWIIGHYLSGIYTVQKDSVTKFVYCDMAKLFEDGFETELPCTLCPAAP